MIRSPKKDRSKFSSPIEELTFLLDRLESRITQARDDYRDEIEKPPPSESEEEGSPDKPPRRLSRFRFGRWQEKAKENHTVAKSQSQHSIPSESFSPPNGKPKVKFISIPDQAEFIEDLRRVAELVVIGENYVTSLQKKEEKEFERQKEAWSTLRDMVDEPEEKDEGDGKEEQSVEYAQIFDLFFERNALEMIVNMLSGMSFDLSLYPRKKKDKEEGEDNEQNGEAAETEIGETAKTEAGDTAETEAEETTETEAGEATGETAPAKAAESYEETASAESCEESAANGDTPQRVKLTEASSQDNDTLLPPLAVATQAVQSVSILIQNVSRATSLYVILSNNHINELIDLPLNLYSAAERNRQKEAGEEVVSRTFSSPELAELTTHFVTFLKSLAMRMNAETLQFFLKYPTESAETGDAQPVSSSHFTADADESFEGDLPSLSKDTADRKVPVRRSAGLKVEFPLYERALEFCAAHQDSFVRVTAMNICLNTLRLTTVSLPDEEDTDEEDDPSASSPNGVLHHARPLPFRERLAIAQHTCAPSRVERLIAPIFTKLAERWNCVDDQIREIDNVKGMTVAEGGDLARARNEKVAKAKERVRRERMVRAFKDKAADLQDELLLLEDVFKVGLTVLNEQMIEMMFATFVYPMLLQPLLLFYQRFNATVDGSRSFCSENPFGGYSADYSDAESILAPVAAPAKTALFTISAIFNTLSNHPLLRLLYTSLFHPLSPDSTSVPTVRSTLEVATEGRKGKSVIRLDPLSSNDHPIPDIRDTYAFGTTPGNRRLSKVKAPSLEALEGTEACVFVLAPALAEVLEFRGDDIALITRTRPNPYRRAILQCLDVPDEMSDIRKLSVGTFDAALTIFDGKFASDILFGVDLKSFADDMPADERNLDSAEAHLEDDRDIGGGGVYESRQALGRQKGGSVGSDLTGEVVAALCGSTIVASKAGPDAWKLTFDEVATHSLLSAIRKNGRALLSASKFLETRWRQAAAFMAEQPNAMLSPMGGATVTLPGSPSVNAQDYNEQMYGGIANVIFFDAPEAPKKTVMPWEEFLEIMDSSKRPSLKGCSVHISTESSFDIICSRVGEVLFADVKTNSEDQQGLQLSRDSARSFLKLDALLSLLKDLAVTGAIKVHSIDLAGIAFSSDGSIVDMKKSSIMPVALTRQIYSPISSGLADVIFSDRKDDEDFMLESGSIIPLAGSPAIPCVCEAPATAAHLFIEAGTGVEAEGVTWQSLYLVFQPGYLVFAQPHTGGSSGDGRVIGACPLERLLVGQDTAPPVSPARRLFLSHKSFDTTPPPLFLFDRLPSQEEYGPFIRVKPFVSSLDVWFEDQRAVDQAYQIISVQIFAAKAERGHRLFEYLAPEKETKGFHW